MRLIILLLLCSSCYGQSDSLALKYKLLDKRIDGIELNLNRCHAQYRIGLVLTIAGTISTTAFALSASDPVGSEDVRKALILTSLLTLTGIIITIDSHKFIGRAGKYKPNY